MPVVVLNLSSSSLGGPALSILVADRAPITLLVDRHMAALDGLQRVEGVTLSIVRERTLLGHKVIHHLGLNCLIDTLLLWHVLVPVIL